MFFRTRSLLPRTSKTITVPHRRISSSSQQPFHSPNNLVLKSRLVYHNSSFKINHVQTRKMNTIPPIRNSSRFARASFWRGGTSNGVMFNAVDVPGWSQLRTDQKSDLDHVEGLLDGFLGAVMGAPDPYMRQLNGMGQGISSTSKVMIVERSGLEGEEEKVDFDYWFAQVGIDTGKVDMSGNCGNMSSAVGPFILDSGMVEDPSKHIDRETISTTEESSRKTGIMSLTLRNINTNKLITSSFHVVEDEHGWRFDEDGDYAIDGVSQTSTPVTLSFHSPSGTKTSSGSALPTGNPIDTLTISPPSTSTSPSPSQFPTTIKATLSDISNPGIMISGEPLLAHFNPFTQTPTTLTSNKSLLTYLEQIRRAGATKMGMNPDAQAVPKIVLLYSPPPAPASSPVVSENKETRIDIVARALSMGQPHKAIPMTMAMNLAALTKIQGTVAWDLVRKDHEQAAGEEGGKNKGEIVNVAHASGTVGVGADVTDTGEVVRTLVVRTARCLMDGWVNFSRRKTKSDKVM